MATRLDFTRRISGSVAARPDANAAVDSFYLAVAQVEKFTVNFGVLTGADVAGKYFTCADASGAVYFWFNTGASDDPAPGGRGIEVAVNAGDTATQIATALAAEVDASFTFSSVGAVVTVTNATTGTRTNAADGDTTAVVTTTQQGSVDGVFDSDGMNWFTRASLDEDDHAGRISGLAASLPADPSGYYGYIYHATDTTDVWEAFPTAWYKLA